MASSEVILCEDDHTYWVNGHRVPGVNEIIDSTWQQGWAIGSVDCMQRGSLIHKIIASAELGQKPQIPERYVMYFYAYLEFKKTTGFKPCRRAGRLRVEERFYNTRFGYAGTIDAVGRLPLVWQRDPGIVDWKTGSTTKKHRLQTAGYDLHEGAGRRAVVVFDERGKWDIRYHNRKSDYEGFKHCVGAYSWWMCD